MQPAAASLKILSADSALLRIRPASRLAALPLALALCLGSPAIALPLLLVALAAALNRSGSPFLQMWRTMRAWLPMAAFVLLVHTLTTTDAAPLGHPSWLGVLRGTTALARITAATCCLALALRMTPLDDLVDGLHWWLRPWRKLGLNTAHLGLVLAVAMGTVPGVLAEGRRIEAVVRLRRAQSSDGRRGLRRWWRRILDRGYVVVPVLEGMFRRADGLVLSVRNRLPKPRTIDVGPTAAESVALGLCAAGIVAMILFWRNPF